MKHVYVLGDGQLGQMLRQAGEPIGIRVYPIGLDNEPEKILFHQSVITAEVEQWPDTSFTKKLALHKAFVNRDIFSTITNRFTQKRLFDELHFPTASWRLLTSKSKLSTIFDTFGEPVIIKRCIGGYDGNNQWHLNFSEIDQLPDDSYGKCIIEQKVDFNDEISLVGARTYEGKFVFYPLTYNLYQKGILRTSVAFSKINKKLQSQAETMLSAVMNKLNYVGIMTIEFFIMNDNLLVNELAPRVHNSGHWTQNGASINQFESHLRAITHLPLPCPLITSMSVMINLIGINLNYSWLTLPSVYLHWYNKEIRKRRKVGHLNITDISAKRLYDTLESLVPLMPEEYTYSINWGKDKIISKNFKA